MMRTKALSLAGAAAVAFGAALPASAQDARGKQAGDFMIGAGVIGVLPRQSGSVDLIGGSPHASTSFTPQLDFTWFATPNIALNLIAATTRHDLEVRGSALGTVDLGHVWALPPTLTLQYHPLPAERISPYVGVGLNYTFFYNEGGGRSAPVNSVNVRNAFGVALNAGIDFELSPHWLFNIDVKKLFLRPDVRVQTAAGPIGASAHLDPWIFGVSVRYRF